MRRSGGRAILAGVDEAKDVVRPGRGVAGRVIVSAPVAFGLQRIAPLLPALLQKHPRLRVELRLENRAIDLLAEGVDLAIRASVELPDSASLVARRLVRIVEGAELSKIELFGLFHRQTRGTAAIHAVLDHIGESLRAAP
jgi:DNA-binding transcriptional LysR family regulator